MNSWDDWERSRREEECNRELKRHNDLLEQQSWEQRQSDQRQQAALDESNRLAREQQKALEEKNQLERQRQWNEDSRYQRELEQRKEQQFKDRMFDLKKQWAKAKSDDERVRFQILLAEVEKEYDIYIEERAEQERIRQEEFEERQRISREQERLSEQKEKKERHKRSRRSMFWTIVILLVFILGTRLLLKKGNFSSSSRTATISSSSTSTSSTSSSSTIKSSLGGKKTSPTVSSNSTPTASRVSIGDYIGRKYTDVVAELKEKKVPENLIKMEEEESSESEPGTIIRQTPASGTTYDLTKVTTITLTVAKKVTSVTMPSYIGSSLEFTKNNLIQIVGVKEANIEVVEVSTAPEGTTEGTVVNQTPKAGEKVDLASTRIKISIYKSKLVTPSSSRSR